MITTRIVTLTVLGPIHTRSTAIGGFGVDAPFARLDDDDETPYLPGSHILGKVRQALKDLLTAQLTSGLRTPTKIIATRSVGVLV